MRTCFYLHLSKYTSLSYLYVVYKVSVSLSGLPLSTLPTAITVIVELSVTVYMNGSEAVPVFISRKKRDHQVHRSTFGQLLRVLNFKL